MSHPQGHGDLIQKDKVDDLIDFLAPAINDLLVRLEGEGFSTSEFIALMLTDETAAAMYEDALRQWGESEQYAKMVIHGQVIPGILRRSPLVEWAGYAHGESDDYSIPALWTLTS